MTFSQLNSMSLYKELQTQLKDSQMKEYKALCLYSHTYKCIYKCIHSFPAPTHSPSSVCKYHYSRHTHYWTVLQLFKQFLNGNNKNDQKLVSFPLQQLTKSIYRSRNCWFTLTHCISRIASKQYFFINSPMCLRTKGKQSTILEVMSLCYGPTA